MYKKSQEMAPIQLPITSKFLWLCALALQLYLGFTIVEEILILTDPFIPSVCGLLMTAQCKRYAIIVSALTVLVYLSMMTPVSWALEKCFYWAWGNMWKGSRVGRVAHWMWGPVEREEEEFEWTEKGFRIADSEVEVVNSSWEVGLTGEEKLISV